MPYAPGVEDRSGELLAQGINGGVAGLAGGLSRYLDKKKKENDNAKYTEALFKNNPELQQAAGVDYETLRGMSAPDKIQTGMAAIAKMHMGQEAQMNQLRAASMKEMLNGRASQQERDSMAPVMAARMDQLMNGDQNPDAVRTWMEDSGADAPMPPRQPPMSAARAMLKAGGETGAIDPRELMAMAKDATTEETATMREIARRKMEMTPKDWKSAGGKNFVLYGNTITPGDAKPEPGVAATDTWMYSDDPEEFKRGVSTVKDPKALDATLKTRIQYLKAMGKTDMLTQLMKDIGGGSSPDGARGSAAGGGSAKAGNRKKFNPATGKFE